MAKSAATNYTVTTPTNEQFQKPGSDADTFDREDVTRLGNALDAHDHSSSGSGLRGAAVARIRSGTNAARPAAGYAGSIYFETDTKDLYVDDGTTWQPISLTTGGIATADLADDCVTSAKVKDGETLDVSITGDANTLDSYHAASFALASHTHSEISEGGIANGAVTTAKIADDAVDDTKVGNRVPQFYRRQGDDYTGGNDWWTSINDPTYSLMNLSDYTPTTVRIQAGQRSISSADPALYTITYPVAFSYAPLVFTQSSTSQTAVRVYDVTATTFKVDAYGTTSHLATPVKISWLAIGPE